MEAFSCPSDIPWREEVYQPPYTETKLRLREVKALPKVTKLRGVKPGCVMLRLFHHLLQWIHLETGGHLACLVIATG